MPSPAPATPAPPAASPWRRRTALVLAAVVVGGVLLSLLLRLEVARSDEREARRAFVELAEARTGALARAVATAAGQVEATAAFFESSNEVERDEFRTFTGQIIHGHPATQALEWIPRVEASARAAVEAAAGRDGLSGFRITERDEAGALRPAGARAEHYPVLFVEPLAGNEAALGFDLGSSPVRRAALDQARRTGRTTATARVRLVQETGHQSGFLLLHAAQRPGAAGAAPAHLGFALGVFRAGDLLQRSGATDPGLTLHLLDESAPEGDRFLAASRGGEPLDAALAPEAELAARAWLSTPLEFGDRTWRVLVEPARPPPGSARSGAALFSGLVVTALLAGYVLLMGARMTRAEAHAAEMRRAKERIEAEAAESRRLELELRHAQKLEAVGRLAAGVAHELNTPLQFIGDNSRFVAEAAVGLRRALDAYRAAAPPEARASLLRLEEELDVEYLAEEAPRALARNLDGVERASRIVKALGLFAHPDGQDRAGADLNAALRATLEVAGGEYRGVADVELALGPLPPVVCHAGELNQVFLHLVLNAAQAIGEAAAGAPARGLIRVESRLDGAEVEIRVSDTGTGIPPEIRDRVFDPFFSTRPLGRGAGQGLAIAHAILARHGGSIRFESELGRGTTFIVRLPVHPPREPRPAEAAAG